MFPFNKSLLSHHHVPRAVRSRAEFAPVPAGISSRTGLRWAKATGDKSPVLVPYALAVN